MKSSGQAENSHKYASQGWLGEINFAKSLIKVARISARKGSILEKTKICSVPASRKILVSIPPLLTNDAAISQ